MKLNVLSKTLFAGWLFILSFSSYAQNNERGCGESCFETQIQSIDEMSGGCIKYTLLVSNDGSCAHALSHYTVGVPCGSITEVTNTGGWKQEIGITDPTTGLTGFKIDEISGFGDDGFAEDFIVEFTVCTSSENCESSLKCWAPEVAYKAGQCVYYEETELSCNNLAAHIETQDVTCNGGTDGSASVIIDAGEEPFSYVWSNNVTTPVNSNLQAGVYLVTITDGAGESITLDATIEQEQPIEASLDINPASCGGTEDGSVSLVVSGGLPPYSYRWSTGDTTDNLQRLAAGYYEVIISDSRNCEIEVPVVVENAVTINLTAVSEKSACNINSGSLDLSVSGGEAPYTFAWSNNATSEDLTNLSAGVYSVNVTDANGCQATRSYMVQEDNPLQLTAVPTKTACVEDNSGSIDLTVSNGSPPYSFSWSNGATTEDISGLAKGYYKVQVTDQNGCEVSLQISIVSESFQVSSSTENPSCTGSADGSINITPVSNEVYTYLWSTGSTAQDLDNLTAGLYDVTITDGSACSRKLYFFLSDPIAFSVSATVENSNCAEGGFSLDLTTSGGTAPYTYIWSDGSTTEDLQNVSSGSYTVNITDANNCTFSESFVLDAGAAGCASLDNPDDGTDNDNTDDGVDEGTDTSPDDGSDDGTDTGGDDGTDDGSGGTDGGTGEDPVDDGDDSTDTGGDENTGEQPGENDLTCTEPFDTEIRLIGVEGNCYTYSAAVQYDGNHSYGLSHYSVAIPCGDIAEVTTSAGWKVEFGTDPTTGLTGFKIDDIHGFGEDTWPEEFEVNFTVCAADDDCLEKLADMNYQVAYKYGQCVDTEAVSTTGNPSATLRAYPNPFSESTKIEFSNLPEGYTTVNVYDHYGNLVKQLYAGFTKRGVVYSLLLDGSELPNDTYTYRINTPFQVYTGKVMLIKR